MKDDHKLQLAFYALLFKPKEDVLIIFKGEKEAKMACKEFAEKTCKSYPNCEGCLAHTVRTNATGKNLIVKHRFAARTYKDGEYDNAVDLTAHDMVWAQEGNHVWASGELTDRLHEFEKLGYEPEQIEKLIKQHDELRRRYSMYRLMNHSTFGKCGTYQDTDSLSSKRNDAVDTLYYMCKLAGDVENAQCDDIRSMYPSMMFTKEGFRELYATNETFKKMMDERIRDAILRPVTKHVQKIWVTTASNTNGPFMDKLKEAMKEAKEYREGIDKLYDSVSKHTGIPRSMLDKQYSECYKSLFEIDEMHTVPADDGWLEACTKPIRSSEPCLPMTDEMRRYIKYDIDFTKNMLEKRNKTNMTITKNPDYQFKIDHVIFNNPATIVFWADGDKTVVKAQNGEPYDPEKGLAMAISKKALGNDRGYYDEFQKQLGRGQKHSTPEQFNSEVCHIQKYDELHDRYREADDDCIIMSSTIAANHARFGEARDYLVKALYNPKSTKTDLMDAMTKAIACVEEPKLEFDAEDATKRIREAAQKATDAFLKLAEDIGGNKGETPV